MKNYLSLSISASLLILTGFTLSQVKDQIELNESALKHSATFDPSLIFRDALNEAEINHGDWKGDLSSGTATYSGLSKYSAIVPISTDDRYNIQKFEQLHEIVLRKIQESGAVGSPGPIVTRPAHTPEEKSNYDWEIRYNFYYTHNERVGEINICKFQNVIFYIHTETTNIRKFKS